MKKEKFNISFKNKPRPTGLASVGHIYGCSILVNKIECGFINGPSLRVNGTQIYMRFIKNDIMEDGNPNCEWINLKLNHPNNFNNLQEAKDYIKTNLKEILSKIPYKLKMDVD
jgi:glucuronate isomerase